MHMLLFLYQPWWYDIIKCTWWFKQIYPCMYAFKGIRLLFGPLLAIATGCTVWCCTCIHTCWYSIILYLYIYVLLPGRLWLDSNMIMYVWLTYLYCMMHSVCVDGKYNVYILCLYWPVIYCLVTLAMQAKGYTIYM